MTVEGLTRAVVHRVTATLFLLVVAAYGGPSLTVGDVTYEDVTLKKEYPRSFFIQHDGGTAFVERSKLNEEQIAELLEPSDKSEPAAAEETAEPGTKIQKSEVEYVHPDPESLTSEEERKFFEACGKADTATIVAMLKENPSLAKITMKGQSYRRAAPQMVDERMIIPPAEPAEATCDALQWLIDESEKSPERIEAIKALVEAGADPSRTTSEKGCNMARNTVSRPSMLTLDELDYLLSKGADPDFGFCVAGYPPAGLLALEFATTEDAAQRDADRQVLELYIKHGADPAETGSPSFIMGPGKGGKKLKDIRIASAADVATAAEDPELDAILAKAKK